MDERLILRENERKNGGKADAWRERMEDRLIPREMEIERTEDSFCQDFCVIYIFLLLHLLAVVEVMDCLGINSE